MSITEALTGWGRCEEGGTEHGFNVDLKLQFDNRLPGPHAQLLMCKNEIALANHFFGLLAATYQGKCGFKDIQNIDSIWRVLSILFFEQKFFNS